MARLMPAEATSRLRVLLVEDQEDDRFLLKFAIRRMPVVVWSSSDNDKDVSKAYAMVNLWTGAKLPRTSP